MALQCHAIALDSIPDESECTNPCFFFFSLFGYHIYFCRENMNEGKSQTFFYFASLMMEQYGIDYAMKLDADSILHLHSFLNFSHHHLPPAPYNRNIFAGALRNKAGWPDGNKADLPRKESFFGNEFEGVHLYL